MNPFRTILVAADFSDESHQAFRSACSLAAGNDAQVVVLHVMEPKYVPDAPVYHAQQTVPIVQVARHLVDYEATKRQLRERYVPDRQVGVEFRAMEGDATEAILRAARETGCDLIAMGTHGRTGVRRLLAGSVAEAVLRRAECPVLAVRPGSVPTEEPTRVILHPTDFSEVSEASLQVARLLARDQAARLVLLHVTPLGALDAGMPLMPDTDADLEALKAVRARIKGADVKCPVDVKTELGDAASEILRAAELDHAALVVMGTHGRSGIGRVLMGSVAEAVLRRCRCAVLVVKTPAPSATTHGDAASIGMGAAAQRW